MNELYQNGDFVKMKISAQKLQSARDFILYALHNTVIGEKLPSVRDLIAGSSSSRTAVETVLTELEKANYIRRLPRSGIIRLPQKQKLTFDVIACHEGGYMRCDFKNFLSEVVDKLFLSAKKRGYSLRMHFVGLNESVEHYCRIAELDDSDGFLLILPNASEIISLFKQTGKVFVAIFPEGKFPECDRVELSSSTVATQMQYLLTLGHRRILYLREEYPDYHARSLMFRRLEYSRLMSENGLQIPKHWKTAYPPDNILYALKCSFSAEPMPTALIIWDRDAKTVYDFLKSRNLVVGKDVSVIATDGDLTLTNLQPPVTTIISHIDHTIQSIWALVEKQLSGNHIPQKIEVMQTFRHGLSVGILPHKIKKSGEIK